MIKLILYRILPLVAGVGIVGASVSPVQGTLELFGAAADALGGNTNIDTPGLTVDTSSLPTAVTGIDKPRDKASKKKQSLLKLAEKADKGEPVEENYGWEAGDRAAKAIEAPAPKKK